MENYDPAEPDAQTRTKVRHGTVMSPPASSQDLRGGKGQTQAPRSPSRRVTCSPMNFLPPLVMHNTRTSPTRSNTVTQIRKTLDGQTLVMSSWPPVTRRAQRCTPTPTWTLWTKTQKTAEVSVSPQQPRTPTLGCWLHREGSVARTLTCLCRVTQLSPLVSTCMPESVNRGHYRLTIHLQGYYCLE